MPDSQLTGKGKFSDVPIRIRSWGIIILIVSGALVHPVFTCLFTCALSFIALKEYFSMIGLARMGIIYSSYALIPIQYFFSYTDNYGGFTCFIPLSALILTVVYFLLFRSEGSGRKNQSIRIFSGVMICIFAIGHLSFIRNLDAPLNGVLGVKVFVLLIILTEFNDVFQYMTGKLFGKRKIAPNISPNKTVEGFLGGIVLTTLLANGLGLFLLPGKTVVFYSLLGILISISGFSGDLYISSVKRNAGVKDTGTLIPGHGGLLDRIDSLIFIAPVYYGLIRLIIIH